MQTFFDDLKIRHIERDVFEKILACISELLFHTDEAFNLFWFSMAGTDE